LLQKQGTKK